MFSPIRRHAFRQLVCRSGRALRTHLRRPFQTWFPYMIWMPLRDAFWALSSSDEDARALGCAWDDARYTADLTQPYGPFEDRGCYCVECLNAVPYDWFNEHEGRCWFCEHIEKHASSSVLDHYHQLYQERY